MARIDDSAFVERPAFFTGQRLFAADLQDLEMFNREMRELHNVSMHQPGIGRGCAVYGKKGDRHVVVQPGYVIDSDGHEIILTNSHDEPIPPVAGDDSGGPAHFALTISYPSDDALEEAEMREGICLTRGAVRLREAPVLCWVRLVQTFDGEYQAMPAALKADIANGRKIRLARVEILNCQLNRDVSIEERRNARPSSVPYIASGEIKPDWQVEESPAPPHLLFG